MIIYIIIFLFILFIIWISVYIFLLKLKIEKLENKIKKLFNNRTNLIPSIYDVTKNDFMRHHDIFSNILKYRKIEFSQNEYTKNFSSIIDIETKIHHELNFIFKIMNRHPKLLKKWKIIYLRELILEKSYELWKLLNLYKKIIIKYNKLIDIKNITILWLFIPIEKKENI